MDYAYLFSGMGVTILYLALKVYHLNNLKNYYRQVITGSALGKYKIKVVDDGEHVHTEITEVRK